MFMCHCEICSLHMYCQAAMYMFSKIMAELVHMTLSVIFDINSLIIGSSFNLVGVVFHGTIWS